MSEHDLFLCHASEDKDAVARPLANALRALGWRVWMDEFELTVGDSLSRSIDAALIQCRFGVVVLSRAFFAKEWPQRELSGLAAREVSDGTKVILPVWHGVDQAYVARYSPTLADRIGASTAAGISQVAAEVSRALQKAGLREAERAQAAPVMRSVTVSTHPAPQDKPPRPRVVTNEAVHVSSRRVPSSTPTAAGGVAPSRPRINLRPVLGSAPAVALWWFVLTEGFDGFRFIQNPFAWLPVLVWFLWCVRRMRGT